MVSSSNPVVIVVNSSKALQINPRTLMFIEEDLKLIIKPIVEFESFRVNDFPLKGYFEAQGG